MGNDRKIDGVLRQILRTVKALSVPNHEDKKLSILKIFCCCKVTVKVTIPCE
jgi:hypothetical protein